jgi:hypothetical protein
MTEPLNSQKAADLIESKTGRRCSRQNLEKLCRAGRLPTSCISLKPIRVNPETLIDEYLHNVDPRQQRAGREPTDAPAPVKVSPADLKRQIAALPDDEIPGFNESRTRREHYLAEKVRLEVQTLQAELVPAAEVKAAAFKLARGVRDSIMAIPDRLAAQLAGTTDARQCHTLLTEELRIALRGLADG